MNPYYFYRNLRQQGHHYLEHSRTLEALFGLANRRRIDDYSPCGGVIGCGLINITKRWVCLLIYVHLVIISYVVTSLCMTQIRTWNSCAMYSGLFLCCIFMAKRSFIVLLLFCCCLVWFYWFLLYSLMEWLTITDKRSFTNLNVYNLIFELQATNMNNWINTYSRVWNNCRHV